MPKVIRDEVLAKRWGLGLLFGGYVVHLATALGFPRQPWIGTSFWFIAAGGAVLYTFVVLRQTWRNYHRQDHSQ